MLRRAGRDDRGASLVEYAALVVLASLVLGALYATGISSKVRVSVGAAVCQVFEGKDCGSDDGTRTNAGSNNGGQQNGGQNKNNGGKQDTGGQKKKDDGGKKKGHGCGGWHFAGCAWHATTSATKHVAGGTWGGIKDTGSGLKSLVTTNPVTTGWGLTKYVWSKSGQPTIDMATKCTTGQWGKCAKAAQCVELNMTGPGCLVQDMIFDDKIKQDVADHKYGDASGRLIWNVGSMFIPTKIPGLNKIGDIAKGASEAGKLSKLAKLAGEAEQAAGRAEKAADKGDVAGARKAAGDAKREADQAKQNARENGCKVGALRLPGARPILPMRLGRAGAAALPDLPAEGGCGDAKRADNAQKQSEKAVRRAQLLHNLWTKLQGPPLNLSEEEAKALTQRLPKNQLENVNKLLDRPGGPQLVKDLDDVAKGGALDPESHDRLLASAAGAKSDNALREAAAEINEVKRIFDGGDVKPGTKIVSGKRAKKGQIELDFGDGQKVNLGNISEVDAAYKSADGTVHVVEVKRTANALWDKLSKKPGQNNALRDWRDADPGGRKIEYKIDSEDNLGKLFEPLGGKPGNPTPIQVIQQTKATLRIGGRAYTPDQLKNVKSVNDLR